MDPRTVRKLSEIEGIKTYFFAPLLKYILENESILIENPGEMNRFATFVLGLTDQFPTPEDFLNILIGPQEPTKAVMVPAIDVFLCFGSDYFHIAKNIARRLGEKGMRHDVISCRLCAEDEESFASDLSKLVGKTLIRKAEGCNLLKLLYSIIKANSELERFYAFSEISMSDLDWDAYVFLKLFTHGSQEKVEEIEMIRDNIIAKFGRKHRELVKLWIDGDDLEIQLLRKLMKPMSIVTENVFPSIIDNLLPIIDSRKEDDISKIYSLISQIHYITIRAIISGNRILVDEIHSKIPVSIKNLMFPGLIRSTVQTSITLLTYFLQFFVSLPESSILKFSDVENAGIYEILTNPWKKDALFKLLLDYQSSFERDVFGFPVKLKEFQQSCVIFAIEFCIEIVSNYERNFKLNWLHPTYKNKLLKTLREEEQHRSTQISAEHVTKIIRELENAPNFFATSPVNQYMANPPANNKSVDEIEEPQLFVSIGKGVFVCARDVEPNDFSMNEQLFVHDSESQGPSAWSFGMTTSNGG
uniref:Uncharacterized protein n=1 Tax=Caenorhabditis angaria TaxID=860376 RepID=B6VBZ7_9PELO|nr:hypothetical protein Csp3_JD06.006 [Caenorhabditis angaria]